MPVFAVASAQSSDYHAMPHSPKLSRGFGRCGSHLQRTIMGVQGQARASSIASGSKWLPSFSAPKAPVHSNRSSNCNMGIIPVRKYLCQRKPIFSRKFNFSGGQFFEVLFTFAKGEIQRSEVFPVGCTKLPFRARFAPSGTSIWTRVRVNVQSTQGERFIWTFRGSGC